MRNSVPRKEYLRLRRELRDMASSMGYTVEFHHHPKIKKYGYRAVVGGWCEFWNKRVAVQIYGKPARRKILSALAHEVRHAMHDTQGLFKDYYNKRHVDACDWAYGRRRKPKNYRLPNRRAGYLAEQDCNNWAHKWLVSHNIYTEPERYPPKSCFASNVHACIKENRPDEYEKILGN